MGAKDNVDKSEINSSSSYSQNLLKLPVNPKRDLYFFFVPWRWFAMTLNSAYTLYNLHK